MDVGDGHGLAVVGVGNDHARQARLEVHEVGGQAEAGHDLGGHCDVESVLARHAVGNTAQTVDDVPKLAIIHVDDTLPHDAARVDAKGVALLDVVVEHGCAKVVGSTDGVEVAGEVKVDVLHGDDLGHAAACGTTLDAKHGAQGGLSQAERGGFANGPEGVREADGRGGLALAGGSGVDGGHEDELALGGLVLEGVDVDLRLVVAVGNQLILGEPDLLGDLGDGERVLLCFLRDLDVRLSHCCKPLSFISCQRVPESARGVVLRCLV